MKEFLNQDFLLENKTSQRLYHEYAAKLPIIDYHCHLSPQEIAEDKRYSSITELWLGADHYKWRALRSFGITEEEITGDAPARLKFQRWSETIPWCIGNPLYHWTHLELQRFFGINKVLGPATAESIWRTANQQIATPDFSTKKLIQRSNVETICTTDDPCADLAWHRKIHSDKNFKTKVLATFRPDKVLKIEQAGFAEYIDRLSVAAGISISSWASLKDAIAQRLDFFHANACRLSDHAFTKIPSYDRLGASPEIAFKRALAGQELAPQDSANFKFELLQYLASLYSAKNWSMQVHIGALRNVNPRVYQKLGADIGFDVTADEAIAAPLAKLLGTMDSNGALSKTILYNLNPSHNFVLATMLGAFQSDERFNFGKIQFGSAWWFNDQKDGILRQLRDLANLGVLGKFIGMLTDSRSILSFPRHEYFRRILCSLIGTWVEAGEYPNEPSILQELVEGISYKNAKQFLEI